MNIPVWSKVRSARREKNEVLRVSGYTGEPRVGTRDSLYSKTEFKSYWGITSASRTGSLNSF